MTEQMEQALISHSLRRVAHASILLIFSTSTTLVYDPLNLLRFSSQEELAELSAMLLQASHDIEGKLSISDVCQGDDAEIARKLQEELNFEDKNLKQVEDERLLQEFLRRERTCEFCQGEVDRDELEGGEIAIHILAECEHHLCRRCAFTEIVEKKRPQRQCDYVCPLASCGTSLTDADVRALLPPHEVDRFIDAALNDLGSSVVKCPTGCGWAVTVEVGLPSTSSASTGHQGELGIDGRPLSIEARKHRDQYRIRCRRCADTDFCAECLTTPYHLGFTCSSHEHFKIQRHCRFCGAQVPKDAPWMIDLVAVGKSATCKMLSSVLVARGVNFKPKSKLDVLKQQIVDSEPLANVCASDECKLWATKGCTNILPCGHVCIGLRDEIKCLGCLQCPDPKDAAAMTHSARGDDFCNICWTGDLKSAPCIMLDCGHVFHHHCLEQKIANKWCGARITFSFLDCPLCKKPLSAPALAPALAPHLELKKAVMTRAEQRLALEGGHKDAAELKPGGRYERQPVQYALHKFAYYLCFQCRQPYFGGHRSCEVAAGEGEAAQYEASEMVCGGCSALGKTTCEKHGAEAIEHKCKFCCSVASWFCWGTTHFCDDCHRKQGTPESMSKKQRNQLPTCTPKTCPLRVAHPPNGEEYVLGCQICRSATAL